jgi:hypothetical protein
MRVRLLSTVTVVTTLLFASFAMAQKKKDRPKQVAISYLKALDGSGNDNARELLLGELTLTAEGFSIPNWKIKKREAAQLEQKSVAAAVQAMRGLDDAGAKALTDIMNLAEGGGDDAMTSVTEDQANQMMAPTRTLSAKFQKDFPLFAYCARAGKEVYWHPENPWREIIDRLGTSGSYTLEFHKFHILEKSGGNNRVWPLRVLRIKSKSYDSGWKILPASDWDPDF